MSESDENCGRGNEVADHGSEIIDDRSYVSGAPIDPVFRRTWESEKRFLQGRIAQLIASRNR